MPLKTGNWWVRGKPKQTEMSVYVFELYLLFCLISVLLSVPAVLRKENTVQTGTETELSSTSNLKKLDY